MVRVEGKESANGWMDSEEATEHEGTGHHNYNNTSLVLVYTFTAPSE
jgi:hypothetical protein